MPKGFFTQGFAILLSRQVTLNEVCECLKDYQIAKRIESSDDPNFGGTSAIIAYKPEVNGYVSVDLFPAPWPDHMGDPKEDAMLFATWSMGHFGPHTYPGGLKRASQQAWRWPEAKDIVPQHRAVIRLRMSYVFGAGGDAPVMPQDWDPREELDFLNKLVSSFSSLDAALCYFNPNGEVVVPFDQFADSLEHSAKHQLPPLDLWSNIRLFNVDDTWKLMDSVGNWQLEIRDHEVAFPLGLVDPQEVDHFIRNVTAYILTKGDVIKDGDTMDGPGKRRWQAKRLENGMSDPPREVLRWLPLKVRNIPAGLLTQAPDSEAEGEAKAKTKPFWKFW
ncbi:MAG: DUF4261 domain-containing protein [Verrucomicrobiaceae bacterium]|nr:MAG: DUF4261 domain-containing protein [Verrucomicrobiaceae bacterium]